jgi:thiazole synthase ThiGH ThiG subunit
MGLTGTPVGAGSGANTEQANMKSSTTEKKSKIRLRTGIGDMAHASELIELGYGCVPVNGELIR